MNDLPTPSNDAQSVPAPSTPISASAPTKEKETVITGGIEAPALKEIGREAPLTPEVISAGVTGQFTSVSLPSAVQQLGVKPVGDAQTPPAAAAVVLPLTDDQIVQGLHQSITSSWRWLAQWCLRRLKQVHLAIKKIHGKFTRVTS